MIYTVNIGDSSRRLWKRGYSRLVWIKEAVGQPIVKAALKVGGEQLAKTKLGATAIAANAAMGAAAATSSLGLTGAATAITAGTGALSGGVAAAAALATPLAPIVAGGALIYGAGKILKKIFD